jgi:nucleoside-diphosphate-sugar epimerase
VSRILVTGAGGFVGSALLPVLLPRHRLILAQRRASDATPPAGAEIRVVGEIGPETEW